VTEETLLPPPYVRKAMLSLAAAPCWIFLAADFDAVDEEISGGRGGGCSDPRSMKMLGHG
jgi:hypothetical protein